jgi:cytochrome c551/c552
MPMAHFQSKYEGNEAEVFSRLAPRSDDRMDQLAQDGVSCSMCHQITADKLGTRESFTGGFVVDTTKDKGERAEFGPYKIEDGQIRIMRSSSGGYRPTEGEHIRKSELCATCHTLITKALGPGGKVVGELPEQMPYQEWLASEFRDKQSCQNCHMPVVEEDTRIAVTLGLPREKMGRHVFVGGNFFMLRMLNRFRNELGVIALPSEFDAAADRTVQHLKTETAKLKIDQINLAAGRLEADVSVENQSGHKFPTAYPSRRAWLHVTVKDRDGRVIFESGALNPNGSIQGNANDASATEFETHYTQITSSDQVQIYEDIMVGTNNVPTTGLLTAVRFIKDNRLLPKGFDKRTVDQEIAPQGEAVTDPDFVGGGDKTRYSIAVGNSQGPFQVEAELWFQPISYRWATNLKSYSGKEPERFTRYYDAMAPGSGVIVDRVSATR